MALKDAIDAANITIKKIDYSKSRPIRSSLGTLDVGPFFKKLADALGSELLSHPEVFKAQRDENIARGLLDTYASEHMAGQGRDGEIVIPPDLVQYTLNRDITAEDSKGEYFLTTKEEYRAVQTGRSYITGCRLKNEQIDEVVRKVKPEYRPHSPKGICLEKLPDTKEEVLIFNDYVPPRWKVWRKKNPRKWNRLPRKPPLLVVKLIKHLIPLPEERQYFYAWLYTSLTSRSFVYLILCGDPGVGKNRLKLVLTGLHGDKNTADGRKATLRERFNSQLKDTTLVWFDELKYDSELENVMKEIQNTSLSIEKKGVDATRSSKIHMSMVISNNKPRDNFIAFDARKFAPLVLGSGDLKKVMTNDEIDILSRKVDPRSEGFDDEYVAQIAKWILDRGKKYTHKFHNMEYKGPMFWTLAHTSMTKWQKRVVDELITNKDRIKNCLVESEGAYRWAYIESKIVRRTGDKTFVFPDYSSVKAFLDIFKDGEGRKAFDTKLVEGKNILGDFYIYPLVDDPSYITEISLAQKAELLKEKDNGKTEETFDL
jgi:hypothetical protein